MIDALARARDTSHPLTFSELGPLVAGWALFGIASMAGGIGVGYRADLLAHRARLDVMARYFAHVLSLPLGFHLGITGASTGSGVESRHGEARGLTRSVHPGRRYR